MNNLAAVEIIEGVVPADSDEQVFEAYQHIIDSGLIYHLQGSYQAAAAALAHCGYIVWEVSK